MPSPASQPIYRSDGLTHSERYLERLCRRSFLSLWSYANVYREPGHELCDLLVVFRDDILIFSDKYCEFPDSANLAQDWRRWFRRTVLKSAKQACGAERWIRSFPDRLFLDAPCTKPFPIELPDPARARFHRILVAHGASDRCRQELGGTGSLMLDPGIVGAMHCADAVTVRPFTIGNVDPSSGFLHVFDDNSLDIVMRELDTTPDFVDYLTKKEAFLTSGRLAFAAGEEELLVSYLGHTNEHGEHDFVIPSEIERVFLNRGAWDRYCFSAARMGRVQANQLSYLWDNLVEAFASSILSGSSYQHVPVSKQEKVARFFAAESRVTRRILARALVDLKEKSRTRKKRTRILPPRPGSPFYVFLFLPRLNDVSEAEYKRVRKFLLDCACTAVRSRYPEALDIVGIATEAGTTDETSFDAIHFDGRRWSPNDEARALGVEREGV